MAILERGNDNWTALSALIERVGTANLLYAIAAINRDNLSKVTHPAAKERAHALCSVLESAANKASRHCDSRSG